MDCKEVFFSTMVSINNNFADPRRDVQMSTTNDNLDEFDHLEINSWQVQMKRLLCRSLWKYLCVRDCVACNNNVSVLNTSSMQELPMCSSEVLKYNVDSLFLSTSQCKCLELNELLM